MQSNEMEGRCKVWERDSIKDVIIVAAPNAVVQRHFEANLQDPNRTLQINIRRP